MTIVFDSVSTRADYASGTSHDQSFTNTAGDVVFGCIFNQSTSGTYDTITGANYGGVAMTRITQGLIADNIGGVQGIVVYGLLGPATGANTFNWTQSAAPAAASSAAISYSGTKQTGLPDNSTSNYNNNTTQLTTSLTPVANNCFILTFGWSERALTVNSSSFTARLGSATQFIVGDKGPITPAASTSSIVDLASSMRIGVIMVSFAPTGGGSLVFTQNNLALLGVS